jgi:hypothetical protein
MLASSNDIDSEAILRAYERALKELESVVCSEPSNSAGISEKLLNVLLTRDKVQKDVVPNISGGSARVGLKLHDLDEELKVNFRVINKGLKPKTKIEILVSLEEVKYLLGNVSQCWWWNKRIEIHWHIWYKFSGWLFRLFSLLLWAASLYYFILIINAWRNGVFSLNSVQGGMAIVGSIFTALFTAVNFLGLGNPIGNYFKDFLLNTVKNRKLSFLKATINFYRLHKLSLDFCVLLISIFLSLWIGNYYYKLQENAITINNDAIKKLWISKESLQEKKEKLKFALILLPQNSIIRRNLATIYEKLSEYDMATKEYEVLLPELESTMELLRLYILKIENSQKDKDINTKNDQNNQNNNNHIISLIYILNNSYYHYCVDFENKINQVKKIDHQDVDVCHYLRDKEAIHQPAFFKKHWKYLVNQNSSLQKTYSDFLQKTYRFYLVRGWARMTQKQYLQAELDLKQAISIAMVGLSLEEKPQDWRRRQAQASCIIAQTLKKQEKDVSDYGTICHKYQPKSSDDYTAWTSEYLVFSDQQNRASPKK